MENSIWQDNASKPTFEKLSNDISCDVLVIGGGIAGIMSAYYLVKQGKNVIVAEGGLIGDGITKKTTAVISAQHDELYADKIKRLGEKNAKAYLDANLQAVEEYKALAKDIDCDFCIKPSYLYSLENDLTYEWEALKKLGYAAELTTDVSLPFDVKSAVKFKDMAEFNPLKFLYAIAKNLNVYENTFIDKIENHTAYSGGYQITFDKCVVATHFPFIDRAGWFFVKMFQKRSYVMAIEGASDVNGTYIDDQVGGFYFRNYKNYLLVGCGDHRTGTNTDAFQKLFAFKERFYPDSAQKYLWGNQDCVTLDGMPYVGEYGRLNDVYAITGFILWGMTGALVGAKIIADLVCGKENEYSDIFRTNRRVLRPQLFINFAVTVVNLLIPTVKRCPHLGCALKYNKREKAWECSCHGSRFDEHGKLTDNPATKDAKF